MSAEKEIIEMLALRLGLRQIGAVVDRALANEETRQGVFDLVKSPDERTSVNALWCLTHFQKRDAAWLQARQNTLIDMLLSESHTGRKRMLLQILREQSYSAETLRTDFLDFCLAKINSCCEPYAVRAFSIYCAFKMCRFYPELIAELEQYLDMLCTQPLSPGLMSATRTTRRRIVRLKSGKL